MTIEINEIDSHTPLRADLKLKILYDDELLLVPVRFAPVCSIFLHRIESLILHDYLISMADRQVRFVLVLSFPKDE